MERTPLHAYIVGNASITVKEPPTTSTPTTDSIIGTRGATIPCPDCQAKRPNKWTLINSLEKEIDGELENSERVLSVLKDRLAELPDDENE